MRDFLDWILGQLRRRPKPLWLILTAHVLALGAALLLYALPHHVIPRTQAAVGVTSTREMAARPTAAPTPEPAEDGTGEDSAQTTEDAAQTPEDAAQDSAAEAAAEDGIPTIIVGDFREKFADKFTDGEIIQTATSYQSPNLNITLSDGYFNSISSHVYVADIYVADISCLSTVFAKDTYGRGYTEWVGDVARRTHSIVALNGDYYGTRDAGVVIRNGGLFRNNKITRDVAVLYWDGRFECFNPFDFDAMREMENGAYQSWYFGPMLMDGAGNALTGMNCDASIAKKNPRSILGYYEPGHYCFIAVDARNKESRGADTHEMAALAQYLGCTQAYNLDGGQTSLLAWGDQLVNKPSDGGRSSSDYIVIADYVSY